MQTPDEFAWEVLASDDFVLTPHEVLTDLIRARDAEVRADERAKVLAGFTEEWGVDLTTRPGKPNLGPPRPTTEAVARKEHAVYQAWFDEGDAAWCAAYEKSTLVRRLVGPWIEMLDDEAR